MKDQNGLAGPVVIGGVGGSGTRVVTEIVKQLGYFMGDDTNFANDNILFAHYFFKQEWYKEFARIEEASFYQSLIEFEDAEMKSVADASESYIGWGWKNPPTHIYLDYLSHHFPHLKYILVIRNGLDMAYSANQNQLHHLGSFFSVSLPDDESLHPKASLEYWIKANERAIQIGRSLLGKRFYILRYEELCENPEKEITKLIKFLGTSHRKDSIAELASLISTPETIGRYKQQDLSIFSKKDLTAVRRLGFKVEQ
ncbi:sulfotransferase family protein [Bacillus sp. KH172YL63]|uniref:sulfotransferase family protein n=1 Tax=Bacillus sp. KH172YL63 TaxID=2709784 RepID=UPI0013E46015|nr:sulfotransferase [Bacillus sp. KH172YL63]BCB06062.1 sulfotransferase family protein [Bacillus sp. KH172YL63]